MTGEWERPPLPDPEDWVAAPGRMTGRNSTAVLPAVGIPRPARVSPPAADTRGDTPAGRPFAEVDLGPLLSTGVRPPDLLCGGLLYAGGLHTITGPPDAGKTFVALSWMLQLLRDGHTVMFLDEEGGADLTAEKLLALGTTEADVCQFRYIPFPGRAWSTGDVLMLRARVDDTRPALILWDSAAVFLARAGLDENAAADVTRFWTDVLQPLAREHGAAVLVIDHDTKSGEASRYARGSGSKLAATDVAWKLEALRPFSRDQDGVLRLTVAKDRRGWLARAHRITVTRNPLAFTLGDDTGAGATDPDDMPPARRKLLEALTAEGQTARQLVDAIAKRHGHGLTRQTVSRELGTLADAGLADRTDQGPGHPALWLRPVSGTPSPGNQRTSNPSHYGSGSKPVAGPPGGTPRPEPQNRRSNPSHDTLGDTPPTGPAGVGVTVAPSFRTGDGTTPPADPAPRWLAGGPAPRPARDLRPPCDPADRAHAPCWDPETMDGRCFTPAPQEEPGQ